MASTTSSISPPDRTCYTRATNSLTSPAFQALRYIRESLSIDSDNATIQGHFDEIIKNKAEINTQKMQQAEN